MLESHKRCSYRIRSIYLEIRRSGAGGGSNQRFYSRIGIATVVLALLTTGVTFLILTGMTPIHPDSQTTLLLTSINAALIAALMMLIGREAFRIARARTRGKAASRLHVRLIVLFSLVAAVPAMIVAIVASITLDLGLDRWFEMRSTTIVNSSISLANSYIQESARNLQGTTLEMVNDLDSQRTLYNLDRSGFTRLLTQQALGRGLISASLVRSNGRNRCTRRHQDRYRHTCSGKVGIGDCIGRQTRTYSARTNKSSQCGNHDARNSRSVSLYRKARRCRHPQFQPM